MLQNSTVINKDKIIYLSLERRRERERERLLRLSSDRRRSRDLVLYSTILKQINITHNIR